jgi:nucleotide-binding universal stress UspA family protein
LIAEDAAEYLSRHGIHAKIVQRHSTEKMASTTILSTAEDIEAAYVVMGAYGHSRVLETLFGGVTVDMLNKSEIPLLLATDLRIFPDAPA